MKFEKEFRAAYPETVGETDSHFDLSNYADWLEVQFESSREHTTEPPTNSAVAEICSNDPCVYCVRSTSGYPETANSRCRECMEWTNFKGRRLQPC